MLSGCSTLGLASKEKPIVHAEHGNYGEAVSQRPASDSDDQAKPTNDTENKVAQNNTANDKDIYDRLVDGFAMGELRSNHEVDDYIRWSIEHPTYLNNLLERSTYFLHYFLEELEKRGLPTELALLPAVESAYKPHATSRSKAAGLWQFIPNTGRYFGLEQSWWYDGRRDLVRSTNAALDYLTSLNQKFDGDWFVTLAAYNAGQGNVRKAINKNLSSGKPIDYESLKLRRETRRYVPKLLGLKRIIQHPEQFGVTLPKVDDLAKIATVKIDHQLDLDDLIQRIDINDDQFRFLNTGFKRWATPPVEASDDYHIVIPVEKLEKTQLVLAQMAQEPRIEYANYTVRSGDTLSQIAQRYGVSVAALKTSNGLRNSQIRIGKQLLIPSHSISKPVSNSRVAEAEPQAINSQLNHQVRAGDTLWSIAKQYRVQLEQLVSWNNLVSNQTLYPNQILKIYQ
jgi:membrane-bound lytic murein transglycosylase D